MAFRSSTGTTVTFAVVDFSIRSSERFKSPRNRDVLG